MDNTVKVSYAGLNDGLEELRIENFNSETLPGNSVLEFSIKPFRTPLTTASSSTFRIYSRDKENRMVNYLTSDLLVTM